MEKAYQVERFLVAGLSQVGPGPALCAVLPQLALLLLAHLAAKSSLKLVEPDHLFGCEHAAHLGANTRLESYLVGLRRGKLFDVLVDLFFVELLASDCLI